VAILTCDGDKHATGGGYNIDGAATGKIVASIPISPNGTPTGWLVSGTSVQGALWVVCI
jgi:hypothetical protein